MRVELYRFEYGEIFWYFCNARKKTSHLGNEYLSMRGLERTAIEDESIDKAEIEVTLPNKRGLLNAEGVDLTEIFSSKVFYGGVKILITEIDTSDNESLVLFRGHIVKPSFDDQDDTLTLSCATAENDMSRRILTRTFQSTCPNILYDRYCGLNFDDWSFEAIITKVDGLLFSYELTETIPVGFLDNGLLLKDGIYTWLQTDGRMYREHIGLKVGDVVKLGAGCDQSRKMCNEKFNNHKRFAGHINIAPTNPVNSPVIK